MRVRQQNSHAATAFLYLLTDNSAAVYAILFLAVLVYGGMFSFIAIVRKKLTAFSDKSAAFSFPKK